MISIANMIDAADENGAIINLTPGKLYVETEAWNLRGKNYLSIRGQGTRVAFNFPSRSVPEIAIDATGAFGLHFDGWKMSLGKNSGQPAVGLLLARGSENQSSGEHQFSRWSIQGWWRSAAVYAMASEMNCWIACFVSNSYPGSVAYWTGRDNSLRVDSQFGVIGVGSTNSCHDFLATGFGHYGMVYGDSRYGVGVVVDGGTHDFHLRGGTMSMRMPAKKANGDVGGACALRIGGGAGAPIRNVLLDAVEWETIGARCSGTVDRTTCGLTIRDSLLQSREEFLRIKAPAEVHGLNISGGRFTPGLEGAG